VKQLGRHFLGGVQSTQYLEVTFPKSMAAVLEAFEELGGFFGTAQRWVAKGFGAAEPLEMGFREIKGEGRPTPGTRPAPVPPSRKPGRKPKPPEVIPLQPIDRDVDMKEPGGGGPKRKDPSNPEVKVPDADPPPKYMRPGDTPSRAWSGAMAYARRRRGRRVRAVKKYRGKKGAKGRRRVFKRYRASKARGRRTSFRRKSRLNYRKSAKPGRRIFKRMKELERTTGIKSDICRWVNYESMALCHRTATMTDAAAEAAGLFPFGYKDGGQKVLTLQKSLFGCVRYIQALDQGRGSINSNSDPRTITFSKTFTETTILNQQKHTCNIRLTKLTARRPVARQFTYDTSGVYTQITNPDVRAYLQHKHKDYTDPEAPDRLKRFLYPEFKSAYSNPISRDWKPGKSMTLRLDPGKSIVVTCKQKNFKCNRQYLENNSWQKGACTWLIEAWGELCHVAARAGVQQTLEPVANFGVTSQGANGLFVPGDVSLDILTKYHSCVSYETAAPFRNFRVNPPSGVGALSQMGIDMYQDIADDN